MAIMDVSFWCMKPRLAVASEFSKFRATSARHFANSAMASSASTPPVIEIGAKRALAAISALVSHDLVDLVASCAMDAAKTSRPARHHIMAPMHIGQGSPVAYSVLPCSAALP
jgi:hypothetical protein